MRGASAVRWPIVQLSDVAEHCLGKMLDRQKNKGRLLPYLRNPNVRWFDVDTSDLLMMRFEEHEDERYGLRAGDVLVCEGGEAGRAAIWDGRLENIKFQKALHRVRVGPQLNARYLVHRLVADYRSGRLADYYTGTTIKHLTGQDLGRYRIPLPSLNEQRRIVAVLDRADALRARRRGVLAQLDALSEGIFVELFGNCATNSKRWTSGVALGEVADIVSGITKGRKIGDTPTRLVPYLAVANVQDKSLNLSVVKMIRATEDEIDRYRLVVNDLLLTEGGDPDKVGRGTLWTNEIAECIHQNHVFRVRLHDERLNPDYSRVSSIG